ncbi:N-methyl-L-tryptophan oxidase [Kineosporia sp. J2-2]|uniref:N-methyl-L-tryptophan oxidase n=1 Tax=Kineosporia corallincola TaxID=2835133 RepID=A0ABS5TS23_9ACTN|nr:N-methyl-L-tryptophan oxidase [Kineosporia corallincola]MBT0773599.1 N-methyl-L-tryptophan oxidase [Kineosporia corallincola]
MVDVDVLVAGLGVHGSATVFELARQGVDVLGLDRFEEGHGRGSSHGRTRMIRRAYPNPAWNPFVERAFDGWARWEAAGGRTLIHRTGGLYAHRGAASMQGRDCRAVTDPAEMSDLMPGFRVPDGYGAVHDPNAGVLEASTALEVARAGARADGAELVFGENVLSWRPEGDGCVVTTDRREIRCNRLVLTAGSWSGQLVPELAHLFEVWRIVTVTLAAGQADGMPPRLGCFSVDRPEGLVFGIPDAAGNGFKAGVDAGPVWDPEVPVAAPSQAEIDELTGLMTAYVPGIAPEVTEVAACLYTMTADKRFVIGTLPWAPNVTVAAACSGHGFKFGPAVGEAVADLVLGRPRPDLDFIGVQRRITT